MIIGIDASRANHEQKTGVEWYAWHLIEEFKTLVPLTDRVILYSDEPLKGELANLPPNFESRVLRWPPKRFWTQVRLSWEMFRRPPDVLFVPAHVLPFIHPKRTVVTIHDVAGAYFPKAYSWFERWYSVWSARFALKRNARSIVPTEHVKQDLLRLTGLQEKKAHISVIPHGVDTAFGIPRGNEEKKIIRQKYQIPDSYLLFVGRLEEKKNVTGLIRAYTLFRAAHPERTEALVLIGKPGFGYEDVEKAKKQSLFNKDIFELGWVEAKDLPSLFQGAQVFAFLSWYEGFGIPLLEAFLSRVPVIASNRSCLPEVGADACLFVDPENEPVVADTMYALLSSKDTKEKCISLGEKQVSAFSWKQTAERTLEILTGVSL